MEDRRETRERRDEAERAEDLELEREDSEGVVGGMRKNVASQTQSAATQSAATQSASQASQQA
jgi:hypothetical protein